MSFLDFLTEGKAPQAVPVSSLEQAILPDWYTNYAMDILSNQQAIANRAFPLYQGPRIADFSALQKQAFEQTPQAAQAYQPYLQQAGRSAADVTQQFMNPYTDQVVNRIGELGTRALKEQVLPGIEGEMIRAGQFGGTRQAELMGRAIRDATEGISAQQAGALQQGYTQSLGAAQREQERQGALASQAQQLALTGVGALQQAGGMQQGQTQRNLDLASADFERQQAYPQEQVKGMIGALQGVAPAVPKAAMKEGTEVPGSMSPSLLASLGSAYATVKGVENLFGGKGP
jgi:hypothetical protein